MTQAAAPALVYNDDLHRYSVGDVTLPSITKVLKLTGFIDSTWFTDEARERGKKTHKACWYLAEGDLDWRSVDLACMARVDAFDRFLREYQPTLLAVERPLHSAVYNFAGTPDFLFNIAGRPALVEVKTGKAGLAAKLQTAAQKVLVEENLGVTNVIRYGFELTKEGRYRFVPHNDHGDRAMFLNMVAAVHRRINEGELKI